MKVSPIAHRRVLDYAYMDLDTLFRDFHISNQGYNDEQAEESRAQYGRSSTYGLSVFFWKIFYDNLLFFGV